MKYLAIVLVLVAVVPAGAAEKEDPVMEVLNDSPEGTPTVKTIRQVTHGPKHHFFGYYGICPWDSTGRYLACFETEFGDRLVAPEDTAVIGLLDLETEAFRPVTTTSAWNFQQSSLLHWLGTAPDRRVIYNDRTGDTFTAVILDMFSGEKEVLSRPLAAVSHDGKQLASINYARLRTTRPGYGYAGLEDPWADELHPEEDGLYVLDIASGKVKLIVSMDQVFRHTPPPAQYRENKMWFNHVIYSRDDKRLFFLARYRPSAPGPLITSAWTAGVDGSDLRCVLPWEWGASHFDWRDGEWMVVSSKFHGKPPWLHVYFRDGAAYSEYTTLAEDVITFDGHCHFSRDGAWLVSDSYPRGKARWRYLYVINPATEKTATLARFHEPPHFKGEWRCDLHPRWNQDGDRLCIDSTCDGSRQIYIVELKMPEKR
jgi:hypothetical protein